MRWPWQREPEPPAPEGPVARPPAPPPPPSPAGWAFLPPLQRTTAGPSMLVRDAARAPWASWHNPSFTGTMTHLVSPATPAGVVDGDGRGTAAARDVPAMPLLPPDRPRARPAAGAGRPVQRTLSPMTSAGDVAGLPVARPVVVPGVPGELPLRVTSAAAPAYPAAGLAQPVAAAAAPVTAPRGDVPGLRGEAGVPATALPAAPGPGPVTGPDVQRSVEVASWSDGDATYVPLPAAEAPAAGAAPSGTAPTAGAGPAAPAAARPGGARRLGLGAPLNHVPVQRTAVQRTASSPDPMATPEPAGPREQRTAPASPPAPEVPVAAPPEPYPAPAPGVQRAPAADGAPPDAPPAGREATNGASASSAGHGVGPAGVQRTAERDGDSAQRGPRAPDGRVGPGDSAPDALAAAPPERPVVPPPPPADDAAPSVPGPRPLQRSTAMPLVPERVAGRDESAGTPDAAVVAPAIPADVPAAPVTVARAAAPAAPELDGAHDPRGADAAAAPSGEAQVPDGASGERVVVARSVGAQASPAAAAPVAPVAVALPLTPERSAAEPSGPAGPGPALQRASAGPATPPPVTSPPEGEGGGAAATTGEGGPRPDAAAEHAAGEHAAREHAAGEHATAVAPLPVSRLADAGGTGAPTPGYLDRPDQRLAPPTRPVPDPRAGADPSPTGPGAADAAEPGGRGSIVGTPPGSTGAPVPPAGHASVPTLGASAAGVRVDVGTGAGPGTRSTPASVQTAGATVARSAAGHHPAPRVPRAVVASPSGTGTTGAVPSGHRADLGGSTPPPSGAASSAEKPAGRVRSTGVAAPSPVGTAGATPVAAVAPDGSAAVLGSPGSVEGASGPAVSRSVAAVRRTSGPATGGSGPRVPTLPWRRPGAGSPPGTLGDAPGFAPAARAASPASSATAAASPAGGAPVGAPAAPVVARWAGDRATPPPTAGPPGGPTSTAGARAATATDVVPTLAVRALGSAPGEDSAGAGAAPGLAAAVTAPLLALAVAPGSAAVQRASDGTWSDDGRSTGPSPTAGDRTSASSAVTPTRAEDALATLADRPVALQRAVGSSPTTTHVQPTVARSRWTAAQTPTGSRARSGLTSRSRRTAAPQVEGEAMTPLHLVRPPETPAVVDEPVDEPVDASSSGVRVEEVETAVAPSDQPSADAGAGDRSARTFTSQELDDLARRLLPSLTRRLRAEILLDRERRGRRTDWR
ncbi:hypothetical protein [Georgenia wangjunii]|uniref:hypothetical protein n=1 Tax=Georgenia wangjunii TaxID=3117730 RepID=UPI002F2602B1